jgi:hypothetical protein
MLVLGHASTTDSNKPSIVVPPFHTGHLGFVPKTPVRIGVVATPQSGRHCEVMVTPFEQDFRDLALVSVVMRDQPGVVARLVEAVAELGINIDIQESSSINLLDHHGVSLIVDLSACSTSKREGFSSPISNSKSPTAVRRLYRGYDSLFPVRDLRFVELFESIVVRCVDIIVWKEISGEYFPDIDIRPYPERRLEKSLVRPIVKDEKALHVKIDLPKQIANRLARVRGTNDKLEYLLVSDTTTRALHVFFFHPDVIPKLFHVGFFHDDVPGALATILSLLRNAKFNIVTSLMRKQGDGRSVWEAVLEYQGKAPMPPNNVRTARSPINQKELQWICDRIVAAEKQNKSRPIDCEIIVGPPEYPRRKRAAKNPVPLSALLGRSKVKSSVDVGHTKLQLLQERRKALAEDSVTRDVAYRGEQLLKLIETRITASEQPVIFLSYPEAANKHGEDLFNYLSRYYRLQRHKELDGEVIADEVIRKIEGSDYFIGIWHHEEKPHKKKKTRSISPWMPFEYGGARTAEKPALLVHSDRLHEDVWKRIDPGVANVEYSGPGFEQETLERILAYCQRHFR